MIETITIEMVSRIKLRDFFAETVPQNIVNVQIERWRNGTTGQCWWYVAVPGDMLADEVTYQVFCDAVTRWLDERLFAASIADGGALRRGIMHMYGVPRPLPVKFVRSLDPLDDETPKPIGGKFPRRE